VRRSKIGIGIHTSQFVYRAWPLAPSSPGPLESDVEGNTRQVSGHRYQAGHRHEGSFAAGQALIEHHAEFLSEKGSFASGEALRLQAHQGTFAEGQEHADPHPEVLENRGGFAAGQRWFSGIRHDNQGLPSFS
jgi:hypothetical protein